MPKAIYNKKNIFAVTNELVDKLKRKALTSKNRRFRFCLHHDNRHQTHEMVIVFHKGAYMPPHRHPQGKSESYHVIEGTMTVYFFDNNGRLKQSIKMAKARSGKAFLYRLSSNEWHMPVATSKWLVYHETYSGPFEKDYDVEFPIWAPKEDDRDGIKQFLAAL